ncbi:uncharacterized protein Z518_10234 [Rhinocladiella mackenziei CBS 650.93]|uniref:Heterokaryon incompatibility domain-containing protein n=1 Tax=Rhinocladiella mackenziei CBS 650.93 TaxID=1442369 RepID=A0A0D2FDC9_9EURO|nr:uncharacterized protein Z518_10234 [Rhinocladiella mackenziei CBS 650.93]KIX00097.1 hypothetical protein Z518_10234 [Rhinocladiella mackenziei CBS 650.93]
MDLNPHLGSQATDGLTEDSWAQKEYNIPPQTAAGEIEVKEAKDIVQTAQTGCIYCTILCIVLNQMYPGWEVESFLRIFVASGLPVVVRLLFGKTVTVERYETPGYVLPAGQIMDLSMDLTDPEKPPVEIEIYRPGFSADRGSVSESVALVLDQLNDRFGPAFGRRPDANDDVCRSFIKRQVDHCIAHHPACSSGVTKPLLPDRVIWLKAPTQDGLQLVEQKDARADYVTLSYCWGPMSPNIYLTNVSTLASRKHEMRFNDLPPLFQDVVNIARRHGIDFLWIDRLCIIQGPGGDFEIQAPKMGEIYGSSTLTIAAASASSENGSYPEANGEIVGPLYSGLETRWRRENQGGDYGKVSKRAWIWQERLLLARTVFYTPAALKFECRCSSLWEGADPAHVGHSWSMRLDDKAHLSWTKLVEDFSARDITYASDRLPAIEAVMRRIAKRTNWGPVYGMWKESLIETLAWQPAQKQDEFAQAMPGDFAPTWSWTSIDGPISYQTVHAQKGALYDADPFVYHLKLLRADPKTGELIVEGKLVPAAVRMRQELGDSEQRTIYEIGNNKDSVNWVKITADTHLRPYLGRFLHGETTPATQHLPAAEAAPSHGWTSTCYCLLIGVGQSRCEVLILGLSSRSLNSFERLGIIGSIPATVFDNRPVEQFVLI